MATVTLALALLFGASQTSLDQRDREAIPVCSPQSFTSRMVFAAGPQRESKQTAIARAAPSKGPEESP